MRFSLAILSIFLFNLFSYALPIQNSEIDSIKSLAERSAEAVDTTAKRTPEAEEDADEAIAYAWFNEEEAM